MTFIETFLAVLTATLISQIVQWWYKKEIEHRIDKGYERIKRLIKGENMGKLIIDIEHGSNQGYVITWYKSTPNALQRLGGTKPEIEKLAFIDAKTLVEWINKQC